MNYVLTCMKDVAQDTLQIHNLGRDSVRDPGEMATLPKAVCNTSILKKLVVYGTGTAIGGY
eukprot:10252100-Ditylum_brightwellii.AAC.1